MARKRKRRPVTLAQVGPGFEGRYEPGEAIIVDPFEPGVRVKATVNIRESAIAHMASRGRINAAQEAAGERFRVLWEKAAIGRQTSIDTTKEAVDGGRAGDVFSDALVQASRDLSLAMCAVGKTGARILTQVIGEGKSIEAVARTWTDSGGVVSGRRAEGYVTGTLIDALDALVEHWGLIAKGRAKPVLSTLLRHGKADPEAATVIRVKNTIRAARNLNVTGPTNEISVGRFGDVVTTAKRPLDSGPVTVHASGNTEVCAPRRKR